jgi:hypothetical protein
MTHHEDGITLLFYVSPSSSTCDFKISIVNYTEDQKA